MLGWYFYENVSKKYIKWILIYIYEATMIYFLWYQLGGFN